MTTEHAPGTSRLVARATNWPHQTDGTDEPADRTARQHTRAHSPDEQNHLARVRVASSNLVVRSKKSHVSPGFGQGRRRSVAHHAHQTAGHRLIGADRTVVQGSMRERRPGSWELRVYAGLDADTHRRRYRTATVHGNRVDAHRALNELVNSVQAERSIGARSTVSELLEAWFAIAAASWARTTIRQIRSVLDRYLHPQLGDLRVGAITPAVIDTCYARLRREGGARGQPVAAGTLARIHVVLRSAFAQAVRWEWVWDNPAERAPPHRVHLTRASATVTRRAQRATREARR